MPVAKKPTPTNGWRTGRDPVQRWLRILTVPILLAVFVYLSVDPDVDADKLPAAFMSIGVVMVLLGYEGIVRLPFIGGKSQQGDQTRDRSGPSRSDRDKQDVEDDGPGGK